MGSTLLLLFLTATSQHTRIVTPHGPVHVLVPSGAATKTLVYVHGFWTSVDEAWSQHRLQAQLETPGTIVIAPEAPSGPGQTVHWPDLAVLLRTVERTLGLTLPHDVIAVGHSGAYRTLAGWVSNPRVTTLALLDAFYAAPQTWSKWLEADPTHRLYVLARATAKRSAPFCAQHAGPQVTCEDSAFTHMGIVTEGQALPRAVAWAAGDDVV